MFLPAEFTKALTDFSKSNILSADVSITTILKETAEIDDLCYYIESNGKFVDFNKEFHSTFIEKNGYNDDIKIAVPFVFSILYLISGGDERLEEFLKMAYPEKDINTAYSLFVFATVQLIKVSLPKAGFNIITVAENVDSVAPIDLSDELALLKKYLQIVCDANDIVKLAALIDEFDTVALTGNKHAVLKSYMNLANMIKSCGIDGNCLKQIYGILQKNGVV